MERRAFDMITIADKIRLWWGWCGDWYQIGECLSALWQFVSLQYLIICDLLTLVNPQPQLLPNFPSSMCHPSRQCVLKLLIAAKLIVAYAFCALVILALKLFFIVKANSTIQYLLCKVFHVCVWKGPTSLKVQLVGSVSNSRNTLVLFLSWMFILACVYVSGWRRCRQYRRSCCCSSGSTTNGDRYELWRAMCSSIEQRSISLSPPAAYITCRVYTQTSLIRTPQIRARLSTGHLQLEFLWQKCFEFGGLNFFPNAQVLICYCQPL